MAVLTLSELCGFVAVVAATLLQPIMLCLQTSTFSGTYYRVNVCQCCPICVLLAEALPGVTLWAEANTPADGVIVLLVVLVQDNIPAAGTTKQVSPLRIQQVWPTAWKCRLLNYETRMQRESTGCTCASMQQLE